jgi:hypothetical protein
MSVVETSESIESIVNKIGYEKIKKLIEKNEIEKQNRIKWNQDNADKIQQYNKKQYYKNVEQSREYHLKKYYEYSKNRYICPECNNEIALLSKTKHIASKKHINNLALKAQQEEVKAQLE